MAFDQTTRNRLARFVSDTRALLTEEFTRQLQNEYGLDPASGEVTPIERLTALDDSQRETARILRETLDYYLAGNPQADAKAFQDLLDRIVREQAFTVLNRLCALRMSEARGLVLESIAKGYQSKGFQLYARLAGSALGETGEAYRSYLFSLMDEFAVDLPVLFDRFSPQGRLFPREAILIKLLVLINDPAIEALWAEDETIGWIYQYFNSKEERKAMRDASQAPRNSRELAVRNQFFTPRYVVEFLTDNTLGRIWYEMTKGETGIKDTCRCLVRRPTEIFINEGEEALELSETNENLSQEELLRQPVNIPHRQLKDPREIKMLDPACGSMHFGLYAFDLFEQIYAEAWELEERLGEDALQRLADLDSLHKTYPDKETYMKDVPRLIIECNIHGVDIDPRAVQIAGLSLWLRAQKSWQTKGLHPSKRPQIRKSNVVCAEPMPGDRQMLEEFLGTLRGDGLETLMRKAWHVPADQKLRATPQMADALAKLVRTVWQEMEMADEAGSLLKIEETLRDAIGTARKESEEKAPLFRVLEYGLDTSPKEQYVQIMAGEDQDFFDRAEGLVLSALKDYTSQAENGRGYRRLLFAEDTTQGFAFIDLCRKRYDFVVMNPPFGSANTNIEMIRGNEEYKNSISKNLAWGFVERANSLVQENGLGFIGAIVDRTIFQKSSYEQFRTNLIKKNSIIAYLDLGYGVLDGADVRASAFTSTTKCSNSPTLFIDVRQQTSESKANLIEDALIPLSDKPFPPNVYFRMVSDLLLLPFASLAYWLSRDTIYSVFKQHTIGDLGFKVGGGLQCNDVFRFVRIFPEITHATEEIWAPFYNGGPFTGYWIQNHQYVLWTGDGRDIKAKIIYEIGDHPSRYVANEQMYFLPGIAGGKRGEYFDVHIFPSGMIFSNEGRAFQSENIDDVGFLIAYLNHPVCQNLVNVYCGQHKGADYLRRIPVPENLLHNKEILAKNAITLFNIKRKWSTLDETSLEFIAPFLTPSNAKTKNLRDNWKEAIAKLIEDNKEYSRVEELIDEIVKQSFGYQFIEELIDLGWTESPRPKDRIELGVPILNDFSAEENYLRALFSYLIGLSFGRWDIHLLNEKAKPNLVDNPYASYPHCSPGMLQDASGRPSTQQDTPTNYPIQIAWDGILVDDEGEPADIEHRIQEILKAIWQTNSETIELEICKVLRISSLREYIRKQTQFFSDHLNRYTMSRRVAPIYWPLSIPSCAYTLWVYYCRLNDQTLYICVNDFVDPKLKQVSEEAARLRLKKGRSVADEKELERLTDFERELKDFREELLRVSKFWKPNLNDGVEITAAPLWKLFQHKPWQKRLKESWQKLEAGEYDWAHLAYSIWPDRVREKCKTDKSLAIAHNLESLYVEPVVPLKKKKNKKQVAYEDTEGWFNDD